MRICIVGGSYDQTPSYRRDRMTAETVLAEELSEMGYDVTTYGSNAFPTHQASRHDLIHVHQIGRAGVLLAQKAKRTALVFTSHNPRAFCRYGDYLNQERVLRFIVRHADASIALSDMENAYLSALAAGSPYASIVTVRNGFPESAFPLRTKTIEDDVLRVLFVGQLKRIKGVDVLLRAASRLPMDYVVSLAYQESYEEEHLRRLARDLGIGDRVRFLGARSGREISDLHAQSTVMVLPTFGEALPTVITEALLSGTPVIASDVGCLSEQIDQYGMVFPAGDDVALARALTDLWSRRSYFLGLGEAMHRYAAVRFSDKTMLQRHLRVYEQAIARNKLRAGRRPPLASVWDILVPAGMRVRNVARKGLAGLRV